MFVYGLSPGVVQTTSPTPLTETCCMSFSTTNAGTRSLRVMGLYVHGRGAGLTAISGLSFRLRAHTADYTGGTSITETPRDPGAPSLMNGSALSNRYDEAQNGNPTTTHLSIGCGAAGASGWFASSVLAMPSLDVVVFGEFGIHVASGLASMSFEESIELTG